MQKTQHLCLLNNTVHGEQNKFAKFGMEVEMAFVSVSFVMFTLKL